MTTDQRNSLILVVIAAIFFLPFLGSTHLFDWDEINFAEISREMLLSGDFLSPQINFQAFYEKPPLFNWLQVVSMNIFGVGEFAARLPNALAGIFTIMLIYRIGTKIYHACFGLFWAFAFMGSFLPFLYFKSGIIDPVYNLFSFSGICAYILFTWNKKRLYLLLAGVLFGLAILTKGPVVLLIAITTILIFSVFKKRLDWIPLVIVSMIALALPAIWLVIETIQNGSSFFTQFFNYHLDLLTTPVAGHKGFLGFHIVVLLIGCFPVSIFAIRAFFKLKSEDTEEQQDFVLGMKILFWVVLVLFTLVQSKIVHYSSLCYFPLTFLAARTMLKISDGKIPFSNAIKSGLLGIGGFYILACFALPLIGKNPGWITPYLNDSFAVENLNATVSWNWIHFFPGLLLLLVILFSFWHITTRRKDNGFIFLFTGSAVFIFLSLALYAPKIEAYSQGAAIEFYKDKANEECYVDTWGFKSYAHLFYTQKQNPGNSQHTVKNWLLSGAVDKTVYIVVRSPKAREFTSTYPKFTEEYRKNGFVFFKRDATFPF